MIFAALNEANFEYDIHSLIKAFYPEEEVLVRAELPEALAAEHPEASYYIVVDDGEDNIGLTLYQDGRLVSDRQVAVDAAGREETGNRLKQTLYRLISDMKVDVNPTDRKETKNRLKQTLYEMLSEYSGRTLPWGTLTGIRPVKIPMDMMKHGRTDDEIRSYMEGKYFASREKIGLSIEIAKREKEILSRLDYENGYSLYIGIPFCPSTCLYCSFTSYPISAWRKRVDDYLDALCREIEATAEMCEGKYLNSVYIGGGTPTSLTPEQLDRLLTQIGKSFHLNDESKRIVYGDQLGTEHVSEDNTYSVNLPGQVHPSNHLLEFTVEAGRPDSITAEKLEVLRKHGISRISINPQTMKEETLQLIGRAHTVEQVKESFHLARDMGFDNINMDLIVGLPEEDIDDVRRTMDEIAALGPDNVTVHSLAVKRASRLRIKHEDYRGLHMENTWDIIRLTADRCRDMGLYPYYLYRQKNMTGNFENVGYAAPGKAGIYNILIMEEVQTIMALGAGATSKVVFCGGERIERAGNVKDAGIYIDRIDEMIERKRRLLERCAAEEVQKEEKNGT